MTRLPHGHAQASGGTTIPADDVVLMIADLADRDDPFEGPVPHHVLRFARYAEQAVRIGEIDLDGHGYDPALAAEYAAVPAARFPRVVYDPVARTLIDGYHRAHAARLRGDDEVPALVGVIETMDPDWTADG
jgi:hypothetical protein